MMIVAELFRPDGPGIPFLVIGAVLLVVAALQTVGRPAWLPFTYRWTAFVIAALFGAGLTTLVLAGWANNADQHRADLKAARENTVLRQEMKQDLVADGWKKSRILRINVANKTVTFLIGPKKCRVTYPLLPTRYGTGELHWWPYLIGLNKFLAFPFPPKALNGLANSCGP